MHEIEVKILEINVSDVEQKLLHKLGFEKEMEGEFHAIFFDDEAKSLKESKRLLRLRKEGDKSVLAFKRNVSREGAKIMEEHQTEVLDFDAAIRLVKGLGYMPTSQTRKIRQVFRKDDIEVVIDDYKDSLGHIPPFLEIEAPSQEALNMWIERLGFEQKQASSWDTRDLVRHYGQISEVNYKETLPLRSTVLRDNWKLEDCIVPDDLEPGSFHLAMDFTAAPMGVASFYPKPLKEYDANGWRLRQMGVSQELQGKGIGRKLMERAFDILEEKKVPYLWCDAREVAFKFYESLGFAYISDYYDVPKVGPHRRMVRRIGGLKD